MADKTRRTRTDSRTGKKSTKQSSSKQTVREKSDKRSRADGSGRKGKSAGRRRKKRMALGTKIALIVCCVLLILIIAAIIVLASKMNMIDTVTLDPSKLSISDEIEYDETGYLNVALFGLDKRENDPELGTRSDTIIVASLNRETKEVRMCSVFRDTLLEQADGSYNKANSAYAYGGAEEAIALLNRNLDMDIQHYVTVDFSALVDVIDALGGIEIDVTEEEVEYLNGYIMEIIENTGVQTVAVSEPGYQTLSGVQATAYARIRYTEGDDYKRAERQRLVLTKIAEKAQNASLGTLNTIIDRVFPKIETNFTLTEILAYAKDVKKYSIGASSGFPFEKEAMKLETGDTVVPLTLKSNVIEFHKFFFGEDGYSPSSTVTAISKEIEYLASGAQPYSGEDSYYNGYTEDDSGGYSDYNDDWGSGGGDYSDPGYDNGYDTGTDYNGYDTYNDYNNYDDGSGYGSGGEY